MKKRNFITGFSAAFVALITLASCGGVRAKDGVVLTINGESFTAKELFEGQKTPAAAEAKFNAVYKAAIRTYFKGDGSIYNEEITRDTKLKVAGSKAEAQSNADKNGTSYDTEWDKILSTNGVDDEAGLYDKYEYELQKTKFEDKFYENRFTDKSETKEGYTTNYDVLRNGGYFRDRDGNVIKTSKKLNGYFNEKQPYHMKHILVKLSKAKQDGDNTDCLITADEAKKIYNIVKELAEGKTFEEVSDHWGDSEDSAKSNHASLGIMSRDTSYVNDFKLGVYLYEALYGQATHSDTTSEKESTENYYSKNATKELFGVDDISSAKTEASGAAYYANLIRQLADPTNTEKDSETGESYKGIGQIPYGEIVKFRESEETLSTETELGIGNVDSTHKVTAQRFSDNGVDLSKVKEKYLPRNVLFNKYFNKHNIMVITPTRVDSDSINDKAKSGDFLKQSSSSTSVIQRNSTGEDVHTSKLDTNYQALPGFSSTGIRAPKNNDVVHINDNDQVLRDEHGRTILVFRSGSSSSSSSNASGYQGIHFIVIERSPFIGREDDQDTHSKEGEQKWTSLNEYYTEYYPGQVGADYHPVYTQGGTDYKKTYTHFITYEKDVTTLKKRADTVKTELKKADDNLNTYVYDYLMAKGIIQFTSTAKELKIDTDIQNWIDYTKRGSTEFEKEKNWDLTWEKYYKNLKARKDSRTKEDDNVEPLIPEICVTAFQKNGLTNIKAKTSSGTTDVTLADLFKEGGAFNA